MLKSDGILNIGFKDCEVFLEINKVGDHVEIQSVLPNGQGAIPFLVSKSLLVDNRIYVTGVKTRVNRINKVDIKKEETETPPVETPSADKV